MQTVLAVRLVAIAAIATGFTAIGNSHPALADGIELESQFLGTQPASVNQRNPSTNGNSSVYSPAQLDAVAGSISGKPPKSKEPSIIPAEIIPEGLVKPPGTKPVDPIDFFKVPGPEPGLKVPINRY